MARDGERSSRKTGEARGCLWIVATPIGTIGDLSPRAAATLATAQLILAEDTRRLARLAQAAGIQLSGRALSFHEHNEDKRLSEAVYALQSGQQVALTSDAGTPVLSDPGFLLVREARRRGFQVLSVPGPSAFITALAASGQPPLPATLAGFLPPRRGGRRRRLEALRTLPGSIVLFLSPHRLKQELLDAAEALGPKRPATLLAELSKAHERATTGALEELAGSSEILQPRGEYVLVIGPPDRGSGTDDSADPVDPELAGVVYREAVRRGYGRADAMRWTASRLGISRRRVFELLQATAPED